MNSIALIGRLGRDPEVRYFETGKVVANFTVAVDRYGEGADWFKVEAWGKTAQVLADYARKGHRIGLNGRMTQEEWTDRATGEKRTGWKLVASAVDLLERREDAGGAPPPASQTAAASTPAPAWNPRPSAGNYSDEDVPF